MNGPGLILISEIINNTASYGSDRPPLLAASASDISHPGGGFVSLGGLLESHCCRLHMTGQI